MKKPVHSHSKSDRSGGCLKGCFFVIIYWAVTVSVGIFLEEGYFLLIMTAVFFISLLIYTLSGKLSKRLNLNPKNLTFSQDLERSRRNRSGGCGGGDGGGGCGGGGCGG